MNIRPWHDETTLPLPLLTGVEHQREFANTEAAVHEMHPQPAECCSELLADPDPAPFVFPLEPLLTAYPWLGPVLLSIVCFVWLCLDGYLANLP